MSKQQTTKLPVASTMLLRHCGWCGPGVRYQTDEYSYSPTIVYYYARRQHIQKLYIQHKNIQPRDKNIQQNIQNLTNKVLKKVKVSK